MKKDKKMGVYIYNTGGVECKRLIMKIGKSIDIDNRIQTFDSSNPKGRLLCFFPLPQPVIDSGCSARINSTLTKYEAFIHLSLSSHHFYQPKSRELFQFNENENPIEIIGNLFEDYGIEPQSVPASQHAQRLRRYSPGRQQKREIIDLLEKFDSEKVKEFDELLHQLDSVERKYVCEEQKNGVLGRMPLMFENKNPSEKIYIVDEKGRVCYNHDGLPIPRKYRDCYMDIRYPAVKFFREESNDFLWKELWEKRKRFLEFYNNIDSKINFEELEKRNTLIEWLEKTIVPGGSAASSLNRDRALNFLRNTRKRNVSSMTNKQRKYFIVIQQTYENSHNTRL